MRSRDYAKRKAGRTKNPQDRANYRKLLNQINNNVKTTIERNNESSGSFTKEKGSTKTQKRT